MSLHEHMLRGSDSQQLSDKMMTPYKQ